MAERVEAWTALALEVEMNLTALFAIGMSDRTGCASRFPNSG
jgi:hypothetical protein